MLEFIREKYVKRQDKIGKIARIFLNNLNPNMGGFLGVRFEMVEGREVKLFPHPALSTNSSEVSENITFTIKAPLTLLSIFLRKMTAFWPK